MTISVRALIMSPLTAWAVIKATQVCGSKTGNDGETGSAGTALF